MVQQARALKRATDKPTKVQYTGIEVLAQATNDLYYADPRDRAMAIAAAINEDLLEVDAMGVDFIQLDEFPWPYFYEDWAIDAFNRAVRCCSTRRSSSRLLGQLGRDACLLPDDTARPGEIFDLTERRARRPRPPRRWCRSPTRRTSTC